MGKTLPKKGAFSEEMEFRKRPTIQRRTQIAFLATRLMGTPFWCLLCMLGFILYKNAHITPLQVAAIVALKPATSLLSPYWYGAIYGRPDKIIANLVGAHFFRYLPFLFLPWIQSAWLIILAFGLYMMLSRASIPAWMELFKHNLPETKREQLVGYGTMTDYLADAALAMLAGFLLDSYPEMWKWFFSLTAALGMTSILWLASITPIQIPKTFIPPPQKQIRWRDEIIKPWQQTWNLLSLRKDFAAYQIGFMLGGGGLMIIHPALPQFFVDTLDLSFVKMGLALSVCKGIGVLCTTPIWTRQFRKLTIFQFSALVTFFATLFPFILFAASWHLSLIYLAYAFYGIMQAGSEMSWHMSGLIFAKEQESLTFSSTNILTAGLRGCVIPTVGALLLPTLHPVGLMLIGALLCLSASTCFLFYGRKSMTFLQQNAK